MKSFFPRTYGPLSVSPKVGGEWRTEIVRDAAVINAYVKKRQAMEEENTTADALAPTGDAEKDRRAKKRYVVLPVLGIWFGADVSSTASDWKRRSRG